MAEPDLRSHLSTLTPALADTILAIAEAISEISVALRSASAAELPSINSSGDRQLQADVLADGIILERLRRSNAVATACSEEQPEIVDLPGSSYSVAYDPLDGSSIVGANFAVGSIFGIWPGKQLLGQKAGDQEAAVYGIYGPKTVLVIATRAGEGRTVKEFSLTQPPSSSAASVWHQSNANICIKHKKVFAPANLRCASENQAYSQLVAEWMSQKYTLRYSGGMVSDVHHIIAKGGGIFCSPQSASSPAKLRLLYEGAPLAFVVEAAGGASHNGTGSVLDQTLTSIDERLVISLGSQGEVERTVQSLAFTQ